MRKKYKKMTKSVIYFLCSKYNISVTGNTAKKKIHLLNFFVYSFYNPSFSINIYYQLDSIALFKTRVPFIIF